MIPRHCKCLEAFFPAPPGSDQTGVFEEVRKAQESSHLQGQKPLQIGLHTGFPLDKLALLPKRNPYLVVAR